MTRTDEKHILRKVFRTDIYISGKRKRGRPKYDGKMQSNETWKSTGLRANMDRVTWSRKNISHTGDPIDSIGLHEGNNKGKDEEE